ncbi:MAG: type II toxin-antitoxin system VapC family toxin [Thermodesulfobacteriota bacterium]
MSSIFVDTSSLVKFYYPEPDSDRIETLLLQAERIYITNLSIVEMASALSKKVRTGDLRKEQETVLWNTFLDDLQTGQMEVVTLDDRDYFKAADLIREFGGRYGIKTLDSLQLSAAHGLHNAEFLCSDKTLNQVASKMGIKLATVR